MAPPLRQLTRAACAVIVAVIAATVLPAETNLPWMVQVRNSDGLTDRNIVGMVQTADGFLWVATARALARFDGAKFEEFKLSDLASPEARKIRAFVASRDGGLWLAVDQGQVVYVGTKGTRVFTEGLSKAPADSMIEDGEGAVWISFQRGPLCRIKDGQVTTFEKNAGLAEGKCTLGTDHDGRVWFVQNGALGLFRNGQFERLIQRGILQSTQIAAAADGSLWVAASNGLFTYTEGGAMVRLSGTKAAQFTGFPVVMLEDRSGALWIGTTPDGLYRYTKGGGLERIPTSYPEITSLAEDHEGNMWVGTAGGGLDCVSAREVIVEGGATGFAHEAIQSVCEDSNGVFWATTQSGAVVVRSGDSWLPGPAGLPTNATCVTSDPHGGVWIGTREQKRPLHRWRDNKLETWGPKQGTVSHTIGVMVAARDGAFWFAGEQPIAVQCLRDGVLRNLTLPGPMGRIQSMTEDGEGRIWIGAEGGMLLRIDGDNLINVTPADSPRSAIRGLHASADGTLWLGYKAGGLGRLKNGQFTRIEVAQGLFSNAVSHLVSDDRGWLWCGGDDGIFKIRLQALNDFAEGRASLVQSARYGAEQQVPPLRITAKAWGSALRGRDGRIWIPMGTALVVADPARARQNSELPPVMLTQVKTDGRLTARYAGLLPPNDRLFPEGVVPLPASEPLRVAPVRQKIEFVFAAPSFSAPENTHFRYRLEGYDDDWSEPGAQRTASYARVPGGNYQFHVQASNSTGVWNQAGATLRLAVAPFYWETWWFRFVALGAFTAVTVAAARSVSHRRLRRRLQIMRERMSLEQERARIARDLHDDAGNRLTRIMLLSKLALRESGQPEKAAVHLEQLSTAARDVTDALDEIVWAVNPRNDTLADVIAYLGRFAVELLDAAGIRCEVEVPERPPSRSVGADARHNLFLAVKEAVNNIARHSGAKQAKLTITSDAAALVICVSDDGRGLAAKAGAPHSNGLRNMRQRMEDIGGRLEIASAADAGARLTFIYPWPRAK